MLASLLTPCLNIFSLKDIGIFGAYSFQDFVYILIYGFQSINVISRFICLNLLGIFHSFCLLPFQYAS